MARGQGHEEVSLQGWLSTLPPPVKWGLVVLSEGAVLKIQEVEVGV